MTPPDARSARQHIPPDATLWRDNVVGRAFGYQKWHTSQQQSSTVFAADDAERRLLQLAQCLPALAQVIDFEQHVSTHKSVTTTSELSKLTVDVTLGKWVIRLQLADESRQLALRLCQSATSARAPAASRFVSVASASDCIDLLVGSIGSGEAVAASVVALLASFKFLPLAIIGNMLEQLGADVQLLMRRPSDFQARLRRDDVYSDRNYVAAVTTDSDSQRLAAWWRVRHKDALYTVGMEICALGSEWVWSFALPTHPNVFTRIDLYLDNARVLAFRENLDYAVARAAERHPTY